MGLFTNRPQSSDPMNFVSVSNNKSLLIVGLGNVGKQYDDTRHNIGFKVIDYFVDKNRDVGEWVVKKDLKCLMASGRFNETKVVIIKPTTMMNLSGEAVQSVAHFYKIPTSQTLVIHDELDLNFGKIMTKVGGSSAGHNGIKSIISCTDENFKRMRIGIGPKEPPQIDSSDFVLSKFNKAESEQIPNLIKEASSMLSEYTYGSGAFTPETRNFIV